MLQEPSAVFPARPDTVFQSRAIQRLARDLEQALHDKVSTVLLTGAPGIGKTTALHMIGTACAKRNDLEVVFLAATRLANGLGDEPSPDIAEACQKAAQSPKNHILLIVDDAHALGVAGKRPVLEAKAARLADGKATTLAFVQCGDIAEGAESSLSADVRKMRLMPLDRDEIEGYLRHRLAQSDQTGPGDRLLFDPEAIDLLFDLSQGIPRFVSHFADQALHEALRENRGTIDGDLLRACLLDAAQLDNPWAVPAPEPGQGKPPDPQAKVDAAGEASRRRDPVPLWAGPPQEILVPKRKSRRWLMLSVIALACIGGIVVWHDLTPGSTDVTETQPPLAVRPPPKPSRAVAEAAVAPAEPAVSPGLGPPTVVSAAPDPAELLATGLSDELADPTRASIAYEGAALTGNARAAYFLGQLFETGSGVPLDLRRAQAWYSVAGDIAGAETRLGALDDLPTGSAEQTAVPVPLQHMLFGSGRVALHWRNGPGDSPQRYVVEYVLANDAGQINHTQTTLSAVLLKGPVLRWRVVSLDDQGRRAGTSGWSSLVPPPR